MHKLLGILADCEVVSLESIHETAPIERENYHTMRFADHGEMMEWPMGRKLLSYQPEKYYVFYIEFKL